MRTQCFAIGLLAILAATVSPAQGQYQWFENFEDGVTPGWSLWVERGSQGSTTVGEIPTLGDLTPHSGLNEAMAYVGGPGTGANFNGGIYKTVTLPLGPGTYLVNGFWKTKDAAPQSMWMEFQMFEGTKTFTDGVDSNLSTYGPNIANGSLLYKADTWGTPAGWSDWMTVTDNNGSTPAGVAYFTTTTGTVTILLKTGNVGALGSGYFDDVFITPEPASLLLLGLGLPLIRRRRR